MKRELGGERGGGGREERAVSRWMAAAGACSPFGCLKAHTEPVGAAPGASCGAKPARRRRRSSRFPFLLNPLAQLERRSLHAL